MEQPNDLVRGVAFNMQIGMGRRNGLNASLGNLASQPIWQEEWPWLCEALIMQVWDASFIENTASNYFLIQHNVIDDLSGSQ